MDTTDFNIELRDIRSIIPYDRNPRDNDSAVDAVARSILEFGFKNPIIVDRDDVIIAGHTRWKAALQLKLAKVPVHVAADLTKEQARAYRLADNKTGELASWDMDILPIELSELRDAEFDMSVMAFSEDELAKLLDSELKTGESDPEAVPEPPEEPVTRPGDVWQLGDHRLICGDATDRQVVATLFADDRAELCFTSPPYNAGENNLGGNQNRVDSKYIGQSDDRTPEEYLSLLVGFTDRALEHCDAVMVNLQMIAGNKRTIIDYLTHYRDHFVDKWAWYKPAAAPAYPPKVLTSALEDVFIFSPERNPSRTIRTASFDRGTLQNVYTGNSAAVENDNCKIHAATMPLHLAEHALRNFSHRGCYIYEPFCGTGTTIIAAERLERKCLAVELEPLYCDIAIRRWEEFTGRKAQLIS